MELASVAADLDEIAVRDAARRRVVRVDEQARLALGFAVARQVGETGIQKMER